MRSTVFRQTLVLILWIGLASPGLAHAQQHGSYSSEDDLIEVMFAPGSRTLLRNDVLVDEGIAATAGIESILQAVPWHTWTRASAGKVMRFTRRVIRFDGNRHSWKARLMRIRWPKWTTIL